MIYVSIDLETGGLDPVNNDILEFGAVIEDTEKQLPLDQLPTLRILFQPKLSYYRLEPIAAAMNADLLKELGNKKSNPLPIDGLSGMFCAWLRHNEFDIGSDGRFSVTVAGKNFASFDRRFLDQVRYLDELVKIRHRALDPTMYYVRSSDVVPPNLSLCLERAGLSFPNLKLHTAVDDAKMVVALIRAGMKGVVQTGTQEKASAF